MKRFRKPWAMTAVMFAGMAFCLPVALAQERAAKAKARQRRRDGGDAADPLLGEGDAAGGGAAGGGWRDELRRAALLAVPTAFDLVATVLMNVGLLSVTVSGC